MKGMPSKMMSTIMFSMAADVPAFYRAQHKRILLMREFFGRRP